jgi:16S rRNA (guanine527-N7)-methyltransferase
MSDARRLEELLAEQGIAPGWVPRLSAYGAIVLKANRDFNLTGAGGPDELLSHLLDSLSVLAWVRDDLVDVGSGAGLPAIPLGIASGVPLLLIESNLKKARFLEGVLAELGLAGRVLGERAETAARRDEFRERFTTGTARAVSSAPTVAELLLPFLGPGGTALLQRGSLEDAERHALADACGMLGARLSGEELLGGERRVLLLQKYAPTPMRFPRRPGIPAKRPLCFT